MATMQPIVNLLGKPFMITKQGSHRWKMGQYLLSIMPRLSIRHGVIFLFNILDSKGISCGGGSKISVEGIIESIGFLQNRISREGKI